MECDGRNLLFTIIVRCVDDATVEQEEGQLLFILLLLRYIFLSLLLHFVTILILLWQINIVVFTVRYSFFNLKNDQLQGHITS